MQILLNIESFKVFLCVRVSTTDETHLYNIVNKKKKKKRKEKKSQQ